MHACHTGHEIYGHKSKSRTPGCRAGGKGIEVELDLQGPLVCAGAVARAGPLGRHLIMRALCCGLEAQRNCNGRLVAVGSWAGCAVCWRKALPGSKAAPPWSCMRMQRTACTASGEIMWLEGMLRKERTAGGWNLQRTCCPVQVGNARHGPLQLSQPPVHAQAHQDVVPPACPPVVPHTPVLSSALCKRLGRTAGFDVVCQAGQHLFLVR